MKLIRYEMELDSCQLPILVKEQEYDYCCSEISTPSKAVALFDHVFHASTKAEEHVFLLALNVKKQVVGLFAVAHGNISQCMIGSREIFQRALCAGAHTIITAHNHPGGDPSPSTEDIAFTYNLTKAGEMIGIPVVDSLIIGKDGTYFSFRESGQIDD